MQYFLCIASAIKAIAKNPLLFMEKYNCFLQNCFIANSFLSAYMITDCAIVHWYIDTKDTITSGIRIFNE